MLLNWIKKYYWILFIILTIILVKKCEDEPTVITETEYITVTDTITKVEIKEIPKTVFVEKVKTIKGKDSIIYVNKPTDTTIQANEYKTKLESNNATANLKIVTTGELIDVKGTIDYTQTNTTITKIKDKSGLFLYGGTSVLPALQNYEIGLDYQIRNKVLIGASISHVQNQTYINAKIGIKIF